MKTSILLLLPVLFLLSSCAPVTQTPTRAPLQDTPTAQSTIETPITPTLSSLVTPIATTFPTIEFSSSSPAVCKPVPVVPDLNAMEINQIPEITNLDWSYGPDTAKVTILAYCSYQKPACNQLSLNLAELHDKYKEDIRIVLRHYPQPEVDDKSLVAAWAAEAAGTQNRFWEMNNTLSTRLSEWGNLTVEEFKTWLIDEAYTLGIPKSQFAADLESDTVHQKVEAMIAGATPLALSETPVMFYNGVLVRSKVDMESLEVLVKYFLLPGQAYLSCPAMTIDPKKQYTATFKTEKGDVVIELFANKAPWAVNSFVFLSRQGWYDGSGFYRVIPGFVVQGGDPSNSGLGNPGYNFSNEVDPSLRFSQPGMLAMANQGADTNGSQFFITYLPLPEIDGKFTIFGQVVEGMDVLRSLRPRNPETDQMLFPPDLLISVTIEEK